ncbi:MAG: glycosyltransferase [Clostridia bacterium]|nr:glycosyltransferase [Clostridia bacterium]
MKVIHLMSTHAFSGAENVACQIINAFKDDANCKMIYVSEINENKKFLDDRVINYYELKKFNYSNVKRAIDELNPDIIHAHDVRAIIIASFFSKRAKVVGHVHGNHENMRKITPKTVLFNKVTKKLDKIIWVSKSALDNYKYKENIMNKSEIIYNAIDVERLYSRISEDKNEYEKYDIVYLGRLSYPKNPIRLLSIIKMIKEKKSDIRVAIIGNGELEEEVKNYILNNKLKDNIVLYGYIDNPYKVLNSSKMMVMTSRYEGTPMCALEAMALEKPIISTPTDGLLDIIDNNETGFYSDDDTMLSRKIIELLDNPDKLARMSENVARKSKEINNIENYKEKIKQIYKMEM